LQTLACLYHYPGNAIGMTNLSIIDWSLLLHFGPPFGIWPGREREQGEHIPLLISQIFFILKKLIKKTEN
jgi:hypothetical protein